MHWVFRNAWYLTEILARFGMNQSSFDEENLRASA